MYNAELEEFKYKRIGESSDSSVKQENWNTAFGLQAVDGLMPSKYMVSLAKENIKGNMTYSEVEHNLSEYYEKIDRSELNRSEKQADEVSVRIVKILNDHAFTFSFLTYKLYHKELFSGVDIGISGKYVGNFRDYNISKKEPVLDGKSVQYADFRMIEETLKYDFDEERSQKYFSMSKDKQIQRISEFTSRIWQVHPFGEGNTRTTAVFIQKYLNSMGFEINNDMFKENSLYFRNALVRANYSSIKDGIDSDNSFLISFFENLLSDAHNVLDNKKLYINSEDKSLDLTNNQAGRK